MYGWEALLPIDVTRVDGTSPDEVDFAIKVQKMLEFQKKVHDEARLNVEKAQEKQKQYDAKHNNKTCQSRGQGVSEIHKKWGAQSW